MSAGKSVIGGSLLYATSNVCGPVRGHGRETPAVLQGERAGRRGSSAAELGGGARPHPTGARRPSGGQLPFRSSRFARHVNRRAVISFRENVYDRPRAHSANGARRAVDVDLRVQITV